MRQLRILALHFEGILEHRFRSLIWFLNAFLNPLIVLLYWYGSLLSSGKSLDGWSLSYFTSYYFILIFVGAFTVSHVEEDIAFEDIQQGNLVKYLLRPLSFYWFKFYEEIPYRVLQGSYGLIVFMLLLILFGKFISITQNPLIMLMSLLMFVLAYFLSFTFKIIMGLLAFWTTEIGGTYQVVEVVTIVLTGVIMPLDLYPQVLKSISFFLPFSYMVYFPIIALQGKLPIPQLLLTIVVQLTWLAVLVGIYRLTWNNGIKKFTGVGQ